MDTRKILFYLLAVLLGGCVPVLSLHSLYTKGDVVFKEKLLGTWVDDPNSPDTIWEFRRIDEPEKAYGLVFTDKEGNKGSFVVHLVKLKNRLFLDIYPDKLPCDIEDPNKADWPYNSLFLIPAHTFIIVDSVEPELKMRLTNDDKMEKLLKEDPNAVKHTFVEDNFVLTASTKELQAFVLKYADDDRVFPNDITLNRRKAKRPRKSGRQSPKDSPGK